MKIYVSPLISDYEKDCYINIQGFVMIDGHKPLCLQITYSKFEYRWYKNVIDLQEQSKANIFKSKLIQAKT